ncbi:hypothetical protein [Spirillospora sp. NPDC047279]|uniref:hypothetical protein n=1 Tax=Spirillospora sp. NPDC047279 TaxID=3155478 RepID=UPI00340CF1DE
MTPGGLRAVVRGRHAVFPSADPQDDVRRWRGYDGVHVFMSGPDRVTAMRLAGPEEARRVQPELRRLVADFRRRARALVSGDDEGWAAFPHGPHIRFEHPGTGVVVEAHEERPDDLDAFFLLEFAETAGGYPAVTAACVHGFHDMLHLLRTGGFLD